MNKHEAIIGAVIAVALIISIATYSIYDRQLQNQEVSKCIELHGNPSYDSHHQVQCVFGPGSR